MNTSSIMYLFGFMSGSFFVMFCVIALAYFKGRKKKEEDKDE